jgi:hypothetical protein
MNKAAWLVAPEGEFVAGDASYSKPGPGEVVIKNAAVAVNPGSVHLPTGLSNTESLLFKP